MRKFLYLLLIFTGLSSCSTYQKALKSDDTALKFKVGDSLYELGKYAKANRLFEQIVPNYRGKPQAEKLMYMYCKSFYEMNDYYVSGYQFERFVSSYPESEKLEEASFLEAKSYYMLSPAYSKDQVDTKKAIEKLQLFINSYPESEYITEANMLIKELDIKLERKAYEIAKQFNTIAEYRRDYEAPIKAFNNFILDYPGSVYREDAMFYRLDSAYNLAVNSVEYKKKERLETAQTYYNAFKKAYSNSGYLEQANTMGAEIEEQLNIINTKS
ncbi:outer membrane protein assembly factor BamD [Mangrovimonas aestuarii]|uniref:outer membrane protein assembly factor BamD n=1 Tax=Mangrovimonas aestuarii TaxID=3018443 RepID=UPI002379023A|nr:outer membrane protein assembly factor BamD [Mangrovimonas aestuarii]